VVFLTLLEELALAAMPLAEAEIARDDMGTLSQELGDK